LIIFLEDELDEFGFFRDEFINHGENLLRFRSSEFFDYTVKNTYLNRSTIEAVIVNLKSISYTFVGRITHTLNIPTIILFDAPDLSQTRTCFENGADDVVLKPVHPEELLLRIAAIKRRTLNQVKLPVKEGLIVHFDGRDPEVNGSRVPLRRRERRILEYLASINGRRANKSQIFEAVYGINEEDYEDTVIESHICRLRKRLKHVLGYDPINSLRYFGYQLDHRSTNHTMSQDFPIVA